MVLCWKHRTQKTKIKFTEYCMSAVTQTHFDLSSRNQGCCSLNACNGCLFKFWTSATLSLVCFITTLLLPALRSFASFQHGSPGQTFILLCQRENEGKRASSPGYVLTLEGCIQFCFLHCCVFAESTSQRKSDWQQARLKGCLAGQRISPIFLRDGGVFLFFICITLYKNLCFSSYLDDFFGLIFLTVTPREPHLQISRHLRPALKAEEGCYKPSYPDGMRMSGHLEWTEIADGGGGP